MWLTIFSAGISMEEFLLGENYVLAPNAIKILLPGRILAVPILQVQCSCLKIQVSFRLLFNLQKYNTFIPLP